MNPTELQRAVTLRLAGWPLATIAQDLGKPFSTVKAALLRHGVKKGSIKDDLIAKAKAELIESVTTDDAVQAALARSVTDDLSAAAALREKLLLAVEKLDANNLHEAQTVARAGAAIAVAFKTTSEMTARHFQLEQIQQRKTPDRESGEPLQAIVDEYLKQTKAANS